MKSGNLLFGIFAITSALAVQVRAQSFLTNGLVAYYPFNGNANDESGNGNNGTVNNAILTTDRFETPNNAYHFSIDANSQITAPDNAVLNFTNQFSVSLWFKYDQPFSYHSDSLVYQFQYPQNIGWEFGVNQDDGAYGVGKYAIYFQGNSRSATNVISYPFLTSWIQAVGVFDGTNANLYINGQFVSRNLTTIGHAAVNLVIGGYANPVGQTYPRDIDDIRVYNRALSASEIQQLYLIEAPEILNIKKAVYVDSPNLKVGTNYQLQVSTDLNTWTNYGGVFTATNTIWRAANYWDVDSWNRLFFRLQIAP